jgi:hypothetical protein
LLIAAEDRRTSAPAWLLEATEQRRTRDQQFQMERNRRVAERDSRSQWIDSPDAVRRYHSNQRRLRP